MEMACPARAVTESILASVLLVACGGDLGSAMGPTPVGSPSDEPASAASEPNQVAPIAGRVAQTIEVGDGPADFMGVGFGSLWVPSIEAGSLTRIDLATGRVTATIPLDTGAATGAHARPFAATAGDEGVWVTSLGDPQALIGIDPATNRIESVIPTPVVPYAVAEGGGSVWVTSRDEEVVLRIDPAVKGVTAEVSVARPTGIVWDGGQLFIASTTDRQLLRLDPASEEVEHVASIGLDTQGVALGAGFVWTADGGSGTVTRVDPASTATLTIPTGAGTWTVAADEAEVWAGSFSREELYRIEPNGSVIAQLRLPGAANNVVVANGVVWVSSYPVDAVFQILPDD
jgi:streptogramin lyase